MLSLRFVTLFLLACCPLAQAELSTDSIAEYFAALTRIEQFNGVVLVNRGPSVELLQAFNTESTPDWARVNVESQF